MTKSKDAGLFSRLFKASSAFRSCLAGTPSGKGVNERTVMQTTAVYACVRILAEAIAGFPLHEFIKKCARQRSYYY